MTQNSLNNYPNFVLVTTCYLETWDLQTWISNVLYILTHHHMFCKSFQCCFSSLLCMRISNKFGRFIHMVFIHCDFWSLNQVSISCIIVSDCFQPRYIPFPMSSETYTEMIMVLFCSICSFLYFMLPPGLSQLPVECNKMWLAMTVLSTLGKFENLLMKYWNRTIVYPDQVLHI